MFPDAKRNKKKRQETRTKNQDEKKLKEENKEFLAAKMGNHIQASSKLKPTTYNR